VEAAAGARTRGPDDQAALLATTQRMRQVAVTRHTVAFMAVSGLATPRGLALPISLAALASVDTRRPRAQGRQATPAFLVALAAAAIHQ
jgi:hypothetical protein